MSPICDECGRTEGIMASASRGSQTRFFCHNDERSCYNARRGRYFDEERDPLEHFRENFEQGAASIEAAWENIRATFLRAYDAVHRLLMGDPKFRRMIRKRNAREKKREAIEARQVARAVVHAERTPPVLHKGKARR